MGADLGRDSPYFSAVWLGEMRVDDIGCENGVDVVEGEGFLGGRGEAGPDYGIGVDGRNEECAFLGCDVVGEVGIGERTAG
jgi:hypothetical protein